MCALLCILNNSIIENIELKSFYLQFLSFYDDICLYFRGILLILNKHWNRQRKNDTQYCCSISQTLLLFFFFECFIIFAMPFKFLFGNCTHESWPFVANHIIFVWFFVYLWIHKLRCCYLLLYHRYYVLPLYAFREVAVAVIQCLTIAYILIYFSFFHLTPTQK